MTGPLTSGLVGLPVTIEYDETWEGLTKNLVCRCSRNGSSSEEYRSILNVENTTNVAHEVMKAGMLLYLGVEGYNADGTLVIPTVWAMCGAIEKGANTGDDLSSDPTLPVWGQLQAQIEQLDRDGIPQETLDEVLRYADAAVQAASEAAQSEQNAATFALQAKTAAENAENSAVNAENLTNEAFQAQRAAEAAAERAESVVNSGGDASLSTEQINALDMMLQVCAFAQSDVSARYSTFRAAFGLDGGDDPEEPVDPEEPEEPEQPGGDDVFDSGLIDLTAQTVGDAGGATHQVLNKHTLIVTRPDTSSSCYSYILVNGLTPGATYDLYMEAYAEAGTASVYGNKTANATDDSNYGSKIQSNTNLVMYNPLTFTLPSNEYGIIIYCYASVTKLRLVAAEG